jgi:hypothetical protein
MHPGRRASTRRPSTDQKASSAHSGHTSATKGSEVKDNNAWIGAALATATTPRCPDDPTNLADIFGRFLRLYVAEGDAIPATIRTYHAQVAQFAAWCQQQGPSPPTATENDIIAYRKYLVDTGYNQRRLRSSWPSCGDCRKPFDGVDSGTTILRLESTRRETGPLVMRE